MASPQCEDGYTKIANELLDAMCTLYLPGNEWKILHSIIRKTYGWNKKVDWISGSQLALMTGLHRSRVCEALRSLLEKHVILKEGRLVAVQKDYSKWDVTRKRNTGNVTENRTHVTQERNELLRKSRHTKDNKDTIQKTLPKPIFSKQELEETTRKTSAMIEAALKASENKSWTVPAHAGGADTLGDKLLPTFLKAVGISADVLPKRRLNAWRKQLSEIASNWPVTPEQAEQALVALFDPAGAYGFKPYSSPLQTSFVTDWEACLGQIATKGRVRQKGDREAEAQASKETERRKRKMERWNAQHGIGTT